MRGVRRPSQSRQIGGRGEEVASWTSSQDAARRHVPLEVPFTPRRGEIVIDDAAGARTGVENTVVTHIDRDVVYTSPSAGKEKEIPRLEC